MDFQDNNDVNSNYESGPHRPAPPPQIPQIVLTQPSKRSGFRTAWGIFIGLSGVVSVVFLLMIIILFAGAITGKSDTLTERVLEDGPGESKIAVVRVHGVIESYSAADVLEQIAQACKDDAVVAVILSVNSPGGTIAASDRIYNEILKCKNHFNKPVIAFMQNIAASGGYYVSAATDQIMAEPTVITGSIGVIMAYPVLEDLLEGKLGINPIVVKSGQKKDWPSSFRIPSDEELTYMQDKIIEPAFMRFKQIVTDGRSTLNMDDVARLADGSIFSAQEALAEKLIDEIGYFDDVAKKAKQMAKVKDAMVVEYVRPFSLGSLLGAKADNKAANLFNIDRYTIYELTTPEIMYLWRAN